MGVEIRKNYRIGKDELYRMKQSCVDAGYYIGEMWGEHRPNFQIIHYGIPTGHKVPYSELAIHVGAAGKDVISAACYDVDKRKVCTVVYETPSGCKKLRGLAGEVLPHELWDDFGYKK